MTTAAITADRALRARRALFGPLTKVLNPLFRRLNGRAGVPLLALVYHTGRRSRRTYATPIGVGTTGDAFLIPLTFGSESDWCRNVLAAGGCTIKYQGREYAVTDPVVVDDDSVRVELKSAFGWFARSQFQAMGTHHFLRLRASLRSGDAVDVVQVR
jgi:deazaflavin-dependent oxidoreductase (nitroreductase family)